MNKYILNNTKENKNGKIKLLKLVNWYNFPIHRLLSLITPICLG